MTRRTLLSIPTAALLLPKALADSSYRDVRDALGPAFAAPRRVPRRRPLSAAAGEYTLSWLRWNGIAIDASGLDHTPPTAGDTHEFGAQLGPCRASRAMAERVGSCGSPRRN